MLKKAVGLILAFLAAMSLCGAFPASARKGNFEIRYPIEGGIIYFSPHTGEITYCDKSVINAVIPEKIEGVAVTGIREYAFLGHQALKSVEMPSVTSIEESAFANCKALESVYMPNVTKIRERAFSVCEALEEVSMPKCASIGSWAFGFCGALKKVSFSKELKSVGEGAFYECGSLKEVYYDGSAGKNVYIDETDGYNAALTGADWRCGAQSAAEGGEGPADIIVKYAVEGGNIYFNTLTGEITKSDETVTGVAVPEKIAGVAVTEIGDSAFKGRKALEHVDTANVMRVGERAFYGCEKLKRVSMPNVTEIRVYAFYECTELSDISMPRIERIGEWAFSQSAVESLYLPKSVRYIGNCAFDWCNGLKNVYYDGTEEERKNISLDIYQPGSLLKANWHYGAQSEEYPIEGAAICFDKTTGTVTGLHGNPTSVSIPEKIEGVAVTAIGNWAFNGCFELVSISMPSVTSIGEEAFYECWELKSVSMPRVTEIGEAAFYGCALEDVSMPSVISIGEDAFCYCRELRSVSVSKSLREVRYGAFYDCEGLNEVYYEGSKKDRENISIDNGDDFNRLLLEANWHYGAEASEKREITVVVDGEELALDAEPIIENGRTLVPMRVIFEALGAKVDWNQETQTATGEKAGVKVSITVGSDKMTVGCAEKELDCAAKNVNGRTLVPVRAIAEAFGAKVSLDNEARRVTIE